MKKAPDPEVVVIRLILRILGRLEEDARLRVLRYVVERCRCKLNPQSENPDLFATPITPT